MIGAGSEKLPRCVIRGRSLAPEDLLLIHEVVRELFQRGRWAIAHALAQRWQWCSVNGQLKIRSIQGILLELERRGWVALPPPMCRQPPRPAWVQVGGPAAGELAPRLAGALGQYRPLRWELVVSGGQRQDWRGLMAQHHYLGAPNLVGANLKYLVRGAGGQLMGALGWQSAVARLECRDRVVGWDRHQRAQWLEHLVNQVRFLVMPWVAVRHLASAMLSESVGVLQRDWPRYYGVAVWMVESFVDPERFSGASYRAANWVPIGWTRGYAKRQSHFIYHGHRKEVYVYVLEKRLRRWVSADATQPLVSSAFLLAQRLSKDPPLSARRKRMTETIESWTPKLPPHWELSEADLECVRHEFNEFAGQFRETFRRIESAELCKLYLQGLLSDTERKNVEAMALELAGEEVVRSLQRLMTEYQWDEPWMQRRHWELSAQALADEQGVWSLDASEVGKKGRESVGVAPQYCGALGKTANCQSGVFICYSSPKGHALLAARLYLPQAWFGAEYQQRREKCRIPAQATFATKPELAQQLLQPLWQSQLFPGQWITCDASFGNNEPFLKQLPAASLYLAEIPCTRKVWVKSAPADPTLEKEGSTVEQLLEAQKLLQWQSRKVCEGEKGPIVAAFARVRVYLNGERTPEAERWLWLRNDADSKIKYALSNAPEDTPLQEMVRVSAARWPIERCFEEDKSELGLDHYEQRSWPAWHRHMQLVFLAQLFLIRLRLKYKKSPGTDAAPNAAATGMDSTSPNTTTGVRPASHPISPGAQLPSLSIPP